MVTENPQLQGGEPDEGRPRESASELPGLGQEPSPENQSTGGAPSEGSRATAQPPGSAIVYCVRCGATMSPGDLFCHCCGWNAEKPLPAIRVAVNPSDRSRLAALLLCLLLGWLGAHRFYVGKIGTGVLWLCTLGFLGTGVLYDLVLISTGEFRDGLHRRVVHWE